MSLFLLLKALHIVGATVLLGTGAGIAFFMAMAHRTADPRLIAHTAGVVVVADAAFTATAVMLQPITGAALARIAGYPLFSGWVGASLALYVSVGVFWLPVVWMQLRMRDLARQAAAEGTGLPASYRRLWRLWLACGVPAFGGVLAIIWLMTAKPEL
jgi:uncharacterized membrane protein